MRAGHCRRPGLRVCHRLCQCAILALATPMALGALVGVLLAPGAAAGQNRDPWAEARARMVEYEVMASGVKDARVCDAMRATPRHEFVAPAMRRYAYFDIAIPIGEGQTISSPFTVAYMTEQLQPTPTDKVLEIGTGSGYQAAVLSRLVSRVYSIEIVEPLGKRAAQTLRRLGCKNVETKIGDGYQGWVEHAPFDKIIVTCSPENVPKPLVDQLKEGGRLVVPLGQRYQQTLVLFKKAGGVLQAEPLQPTFFVPMMGRAEAERAVEADAGEPMLVNGDFKDVAGDQPVGWYYVRQGKVETGGRTPEGQLPLVSQRRAGPGGASFAGSGCRWPVDAGNRTIVVGPREERATRFAAGAISVIVGGILQLQSPTGCPTEHRAVVRQLRLDWAAPANQGAAFGPPGQRGSGSVGWNGATVSGRGGAESGCFETSTG
jgi:protein-L-isoaspartate(D-aspartate) O-methyltransferase